MKNRGFTLVELVIVVAIISVIAMLAVPSYQQYREASDTKLAIAYVTIINLAIERYHVQHNRFPNQLADIGTLPNNLKDPWGNNFVYLNIADGGPTALAQARKDKNLFPINTRYDLYSKGKNGVTRNQISIRESLDDIILARDGAFIGLAEDF